MADALSRQSKVTVELAGLQVQPSGGASGGFLASFWVRPVLLDRIREAQADSVEVQLIKAEMAAGKRQGFTFADGVLKVGSRLYVPDQGTLRTEILEEAHSSPYVVHPGSTKMYHDLKTHYVWDGMKKDIADFVSRC